MCCNDGIAQCHVYCNGWDLASLFSFNVAPLWWHQLLLLNLCHSQVPAFGLMMSIAYSLLPACADPHLLVVGASVPSALPSATQPPCSALRLLQAHPGFTAGCRCVQRQWRPWAGGTATSGCPPESLTQTLITVFLGGYASSHTANGGGGSSGNWWVIWRMAHGASNRATAQSVSYVLSFMTSRS